MITERTVVYSSLPTLADLKNVLRVSGTNTTIDNIIHRTLRQAQSTLERQTGYVIGTGSFIWEREVVSGRRYVLPRSPVSAITAVSPSTSYVEYTDPIFGVKCLVFDESIRVQMHFDVAVPMILPGEVSEAIEAYVYDRFTNEPPYTFSIAKALKGTAINPYRV